MKLIFALVLLSCALCALASNSLHDSFAFEYNAKPEDTEGLSCNSAKCVGAGESCSSRDGITFGCRPGTYASLEGREHKFCICRPIPFSVWRMPCNMTGLYECGIDLKCQADHEGINRCLGKRNHGDACSTNMDCRTGHDCKDGFCMSILQAGSSCKAQSPGALDVCPPDTACRQNWLGQFICKPKSAEGEACKTSACCKSGLGCNNGTCASFFTLQNGAMTDDALLCQSGYMIWGFCAPLPNNWHDIEGAPCTGKCGPAGSCMCSTWEKRNNTGICMAKSAYDHKAQDAIRAVFAMTSGKCYPDLMTPGLFLQPIPAYDCAMRLVGPKLMSTAFCWYLRNVQLLNGNGLAPNCDPGFSLWLASFCPKM